MIRHVQSRVSDTLDKMSLLHHADKDWSKSFPQAFEEKLHDGRGMALLCVAMFYFFQVSAL